MLLVIKNLAEILCLYYLLSVFILGLTYYKILNREYLEIFVFTKRLIKNPFAVVSLALFFVFTGAENLVFFSDSEPIATAEAKDKDNNKDKDKDDDGECDIGNDGFCYKKDKLEVTALCKDVKVLKILYHEDFIATENAPGPNVLVTGIKGKKCFITIDKVTGGDKCGFRVFIENKPYGKTLQVLTKPKGKAKDCEMCIHLKVPRKIHIGPPPTGIF